VRITRSRHEGSPGCSRRPHCAGGCPSVYNEPISPEDQASIQFLAENSTDVICRAGADTMLHYASPSSFHVLGWKPEEMVGKRTDVFVVAEDVLALTANQVEGSRVSVRMRRKDGSLAWVEIKRRLVCDATTGEPRETLFLMHDVTERKVLEEKLSLLAATDTHTGLSTHSAFDEALEREWNRALREGSRISLLLLDFHDFKLFHGWPGHLEGDGCLEKAATVVMGALRLTDVAAHYGAEDIAILLPSTGPSGAAKVAGKVKSAFQALRPPRSDTAKAEIGVPLSIGIATVFARPGATVNMPEILLLAVNAALHAARQRDGERILRLRT
jgi:diguanylate cyclase (GGDEF)-like protein/PAS domain S-box-containing protein